MLSLANLLRGNSYIIEFYFDQRIHNLESSIIEAKLHGFDTHFEPIKTKIKGSAITKDFGQVLLYRPFVFIRRVFNELKICRRIEFGFKEVLIKRSINLVITPLNSVGYNIPVYLNVCKNLNIKTVCFPFAFGDKDALIKSLVFSNKSNAKYLLNSVFIPFFKKWTLNLNNEKYLILPAEQLVTYFFKNINVKYPFSFYGVYIDYIFLENEYMLRHATEQKLASNCVKLTGSIFDDSIFNIQFNKNKNYNDICLKYGWDSNLKLLVIGLPPFVKSGELDLRFLSVDELLLKFIPFEIKNWNVIISPHPRINKNELSALVLKDNMRLIDESVENFLPLANLFISTFSSTIRTAIGLGKAVINYDLLNFNYLIFNEIKGVVKVNNSREYEFLLKKIDQDGDSFLTERIDESDTYLYGSNFDGKSNQRILNEIKQISC